MKKIRKSFIFTSLLYMALGIVLLVWPDISLNVVCFSFGVVTLLYGVVKLFMYVANRSDGGFFYQIHLVVGVIAIALGVFFLMRPDIIISIFPIMIGLFIIFHSIVKVQGAFELRKVEYDKWWGILVAAIVTAGLGIIIVRNPFATVEAMVMAVGIILILDSLLNIASTIFASYIVKKYTKMVNEVFYPDYNYSKDSRADEEKESVTVDYKEE
ncbi:MAG: hypothetical protein HFI78_11555 [Lachnospiraceae bacterium]|jgi:uncharacterized membrane protein HdeD (DUF308 family)|nr:hypothetical protein [Lachnospiraceae bacterium]